MKYKKLLPILTIITLIAVASFGNSNQITATTPLDEIILYMSPDAQSPYVGDLVNVTIVFRHAINTTSSLYNVTLEITNPTSLNITNVYDLSSNMTGYDLETYKSNPNNTEPLFWWDNTKVNATWGQFDAQRLETFWFILNITEEGDLAPTSFDLTYTLEGETETIEGESLFFEGVIERPVPSSIPNPIRGELTWFWWLAGSVLIVLPLIIIIITRLTLWKR